MAGRRVLLIGLLAMAVAVLAAPLASATIRDTESAPRSATTVATRSARRRWPAA